MTENTAWQKELERMTPTPLVAPRFRVKRLPSGSFELSIYQHRAPKPPNEKIGVPVLEARTFPVTSRAAHELFEELVSVLAQEGGN